MIETNKKDTSHIVDEEIVTRESFAVTAIQMLAMQIFIGISYFIIIESIGIANIELDWRRILVFSFVESVQVLFSIYAFLSWYNRFYQIRNKEFIFHKGAIFGHSDYYSLERLETIKHIRTLGGMIFGYSSVKIMIHHNDRREVLFINNITNHTKIIKKLESSLQKG